MIPKWKLKRELDRLKVQARAIPMGLYEPFVQRAHDRSRAKTVRVDQGMQTAGEGLAIFLIYQPGALPASLIRTVQHMLENGVTPVIVSNAPLTEDARAALLPLSAAVAERPNLGYDFGGYRDGLWLLDKLGMKPHNLLILNDSVWFPAWSNSTLLADMLAADADYVGTQVFGDPFATSGRKGMFGSYCFMVKEPLLSSAPFRDFWSGYRLSSNKEVTLRRGERAFSHAMLDRTDRALGLYSTPRFRDVVDALDTDALREACRDAVVLPPDLIARQANLTNARTDGSWPDDARSFLKDSAASKNYIGAAPILSLRDMGFPMIKKNREMIYRLARQRIVRAIDEGRLTGLEPDITAELRTSAEADRDDLDRIWAEGSGG